MSKHWSERFEAGRAWFQRRSPRAQMVIRLILTGLICFLAGRCSAPC